MNTPAKPDMPLCLLGGGGPSVSLHALGTMTFGAETDEAEAHRMLDLFVARGGTLIDTAGRLRRRRVGGDDWAVGGGARRDG